MQAQYNHKNYLLKGLLCAATVSLLSGCSSRVENAIELVQTAIKGPQDYTLTPEQIKAYPYAAQYARFDDQPQNLLALSFTTPTINEQETLSWVSATNEIITTLHGRVIHTAGVAGGIHHYQNLANDPLQCYIRQADTNANTNAQTNAQNTSCATQWHTTITFGGALPHDVQQFQAQSTFAVQGEQTLTLPNGNQVRAQKLTETMKLNGQTYTNDYYLGASNETAPLQVLQTRQIVSLEYGALQLTQVKRYGGGYQAPNTTGPGPQTIQLAVQFGANVQQQTAQPAQQANAQQQTSIPALSRVQQPVRELLLANQYNPHEILWAYSRIISTGKQQAVTALQQQAAKTAAQISQTLASHIEQWPVIGAEPASQLALTASAEVQPGTPTHTASRAFNYYQAQYNPTANAALTANQGYSVIAPTQTPPFTLINSAGSAGSTNKSTNSAHSAIKTIPYTPNLSAAEFIQQHAPNYTGSTIYVADTQGVVQEVAAQNFNVTDYKLPLGAVIWLPVTDNHPQAQQLNQQLRELLSYVYTAPYAYTEKASEQQHGGAQ